MTDWDKRFMDLAILISQWSKDRNTKVGCVIVGPDNEIRSTGYNGFPRGSHDDVESRHERPAKYRWTEHAERNAIYNAARVGISLKDCRIYLPWFPCMDCARGIVQSGISTLVALQPDVNDSKWGEDFQIALELFSEVGVRVVWYDEVTKP
jgi:dCMP deaminase